MKRETLRHPKTYDLMARLQCSRPEALGVLTLLWDFTAEVAPCGNIGKFPDGAIARACEWPGNPSDFVAALVASRFIDLDPTHRLLIHDWPIHCERWVKSKLQSLSLSFATPHVSRDASTDASPPTSRDPPRDQTNPNQPKPTQTNPCAAFAADPPDPPQVDSSARRPNRPACETAALPIPAALAADPFPAAWSDWLAYRRERRLSTRDRTISAQLDSLAPLGPAAAAECLQTSIRNGWQGIFPEKTTNGKPTSRVTAGQRYREPG